MMELNADFLSRLINQIRQQGAVAITLGSGTRLIATWKQDAAAIPTIEVKVVPPQSVQGDVANEAADDTRPRILCPTCRGDRGIDTPWGGQATCHTCLGHGWIYQE